MSTPTGPHLDLDALADLLAGEGTEDDVVHVAACDRCSADLADLDAALGAVAAELTAYAGRAVPAPPADLEDRLRARLAEEPVPLRPAPPDEPAPSPSGSADPADPPAVRSRHVVPLHPHRPRRAVPAALGVAAASAALLALVGLGVGAGGSSESGVSATSSQAGAPAGGAGAGSGLLDLPVSATGTDYRRDGRALALALPALLGAQERVAASASTRSRQGPTAGEAQSGDQSGARPAAPAPVAGSAPAAASGPSELAEQLSTPAVDPLARLRDPAELAGCLSALTGPDVEGVPLALDYASFEGAPALVVVLPSAQPDRVDVFTVGAGCRAGDDRTLLFTRLPRP